MVELLIFIALLFLVIMPLGRRVLIGLFRLRLSSFLEEAFMSFALGSGIIGLIVLCIGTSGLLYKRPVVVILMLLALSLIKDSMRIVSDLFKFLKGIPALKISRFEMLLLAFLLFTWLFTLMGSLSPVLGIDALSYHLRDPKLFIGMHKITLVPHTRDSLWPFLVEMLYTLGLLLKTEVLSKLFHFGFGVSAIISLYCLCRRYWPRAQALFTCCVYALTPVIFTTATYAYTELASVLYVMTIYFIFFVWLDGQKASWIYLSAVFCGFLMGTKITSAPVIAIFLCLYIFNIVRKRYGAGRTFTSMLAFALIFIAVGGIWYIRSWLILGNPIFPFASYIFGYGYPENELRYHLIAGLGLSPLSYVRMLWPLTLYPDIFGGESIGPLFLMLLPFLIFAKDPPRFIRYVLFIAIAMYTAWFFTFQYTRFFATTIPLLSILSAYVFFYILNRDKVISIISKAAAVLVFMYACAISAYHNAEKIPVALGFEGRGDYLYKHERSFAVAEYINGNLPDDSKILVIGDPKLFYYDRDAALAISVKLNMLYDRNVVYKGSLEGYLRSLDFDYILYSEDRSVGGDPEPCFTPDSIFVGEKKELVKSFDFSDKDEVYAYQLWKIKKPFRKNR